MSFARECLRSFISSFPRGTSHTKLEQQSSTMTMMLSAATAAQSLLRRPAARLLPSSWASASVTSVMSKRAATMAMSTLPPELPESVLSGEDKSLNRLTRTESMVRSDASQFRVLSYSLYLCLIDVRSPDEFFWQSRLSHPSLPDFIFITYTNCNCLIMNPKCYSTKINQTHISINWANIVPTHLN